MASDLFTSAAAGAGLELLFGSFIDLVVDMIKKNSMFLPILKRLKGTLDSIDPLVKRLDAFNREFDRPKEIDRLKELMIEGRELVNKCSKIHPYNYVKKPFYTKKLQDLEKSLRGYATLDLQIQQSADQKETLFGVGQISLGVKHIDHELRQLSNQLSQLSSVTTSSGGFSKRSSLVGVCSPPGLRVAPVGLEIPLRDLKRKLIKEEIPFIVISAAGGCGKTTLATLLCHDADIQARFEDNIFFVTVSKPPNLLVIVRRLFQQNNYELPEFQSEEDVFNQLEIMLKTVGSSPILLVLDDVWSGSESLLEKLKFQIKNYQILVTSRSEFPRFGSTYKLQILSNADAMTLFCQSADIPDRNFCIPVEDVNKLVRSCKGFPIAISVLGKSLCRKHAAEWRKRVKECSSTAILFDSEVLTCLQRSVDALDDQVKECYKDLGSFLEDHRIPTSTLIDMWVELHKLDEDDAMKNLHELSDFNMVDLVVIRKDTSGDDTDFVIQHDLLRELAILQSNSVYIEHRKRLFLDISGKKFPQWWIEQKQLFTNASLLSICTDETFSSSGYSIQAPEVEVLVLNFQTKNYTLPNFIERMDKLKVLIVTNYDSLHAELNSFPLLGSLSSLKRIRLQKISIPPLFFTSQALKNLEKMSLVMCNIGQAFSNFASDAFPNVAEINIDYCNDLVELPMGFCELVQLKRLSVTNCHKLCVLPEEIRKLVNLELLRLHSCIELLELPETIGGLHKLSILDMSECLSISKLPEQISELYNLRQLYMIDCSNCQLPSSVLNLVHLREVIGDRETASSWEHFKPFLPDLTIRVHKDVNLNWLH